MIGTLFHLITLLFAAIMAIPAAVLFIEAVASFFPLRKGKRAIRPEPASFSYVVLIPAHNEAAGIGPVLARLKEEVADPCQIVVIADNCSDDTAEIGRQQGVTVLERSDTVRKGKGFALDYGLSKLAAATPPEIVIMLDADCLVEAGGVQRIAQMAYQTQRPVQAIYLQTPPPQPKSTDLVSAFAYLVKNRVRPLGLSQLGLPCQLTGSGMAFPWEIICKAPLASGNIVEDMQLGYDLAIAGHSPLLVADVLISAELPAQRTAATSQRTRWEHGHLQTLLTQVPRLFKAGLQQRRGDLLALAADLTIPPLALFVMLWGLGMSMATAVGLVWKLWRAARWFAVLGFTIFIAVGGAWAKFGRNTLPLRTLLGIPFYLLWKIPLYFRFLIQRQTTWVRTERNHS